MKIARTRLIDELRARGRLSQPLPDEDCGPLPLAKDPGPPETASTAEMVDLAQRALAQLPVSLREVVLLRLHEDLDYAAIGTIVGVGETTARSRMRYALEALRDRLKAEP